MKRGANWDDAYTLSSDSSDEENESGGAKKGNGKAVTGVSRYAMSEGVVIRRAQIYQEYMKSIPIPTRRGSVIPFTTWQGLAKAIKKLYGQPLHYMTNVHLKQLDLLRIGSDDEYLPLDAIIHPVKAEATVWLIEEVHRLNSAKKRAGAIDYEALTKHGYKSGPSVLNVPPPREVNEKEPDWSWSTGKEQAVVNKGTEESYEERQKTRAAVTQGELLTTALTSKEKKNMCFSQKEKRKRELGQASRGKNYVEEEKRLLRESGVYSGFDS